jgi:hypothetical protein
LERRKKRGDRHPELVQDPVLYFEQKNSLTDTRYKGTKKAEYIIRRKRKNFIYNHRLR